MIIIKYFYHASLGVNYQLNPPHIWMGGGGWWREIKLQYKMSIDPAWLHEQDNRRVIITRWKVEKHLSWASVENVGLILRQYCGYQVDIVQTNLFPHGVVQKDWPRLKS